MQCLQLVYTAQSMPLVAHVKNLLESRGIACEIRNEFLAGGVGELPPIQCWPEVWVDDFQAQYAREVVAAFVEAGDENPVGSDWTCTACGERVAGNFGACWNCDTPRSGTG